MNNDYKNKMSRRFIKAVATTLCAAIAAQTAGATQASAWSTTPDWVVGDVNRDMVLDLQDISMVAELVSRKMLGLEVTDYEQDYIYEPRWFAANVDLDVSVTMSDLIWLLEKYNVEYVLGGELYTPAESPLLYDKVLVVKRELEVQYDDPKGFCPCGDALRVGETFHVIRYLGDNWYAIMPHVNRYGLWPKEDYIRVEPEKFDEYLYYEDGTQFGSYTPWT